MVNLDKIGQFNCIGLSFELDRSNWWVFLDEMGGPKPDDREEIN